MLTPGGNWQWYWEEDVNRLAIRLQDDLCLVTAYCKKSIRDHVACDLAFSLSDTQTYYSCMETLQLMCPHLSDAEQVQISLNACAAIKFHKPVGLKSWFFQTQSGYLNTCKLADVCAESSASVLILEQEGIAATCMVLDKSLAITSSKTVEQFSLIKVATDRLGAITAPNLQQKSA